MTQDDKESIWKLFWESDKNLPYQVGTVGGALVGLGVYGLSLDTILDMATDDVTNSFGDYILPSLGMATGVGIGAASIVTIPRTLGGKVVGSLLGFVAYAAVTNGLVGDYFFPDVDGSGHGH